MHWFLKETYDALQCVWCSTRTVTNFWKRYQYVDNFNKFSHKIDEPWTMADIVEPGDHIDQLTEHCDD